MKDQEPRLIKEYPRFKRREIWGDKNDSRMRISTGNRKLRWLNKKETSMKTSIQENLEEYIPWLIHNR